jgi:hypothetical protein
LDCPELVWLCGEYAEEVAVPDYVQVFLGELEQGLEDLDCRLVLVCRAGEVYKIFYYCLGVVNAVVVSDDVVRRFVEERIWGV